MVTFADGESRFEMDAGPRHHNPMGTVHGGILCTLADSAMGMAFARAVSTCSVLRGEKAEGR